MTKILRKNTMREATDGEGIGQVALESPTWNGRHALGHLLAYLRKEALTLTVFIEDECCACWHTTKMTLMDMSSNSAAVLLP